MNEQLMQEIKEFCQEHYEEGYDVFVEAFEDEELIEFCKGEPEYEIKEVETVPEFVKRAEALIDVREERRKAAKYYSGE